MKERLECEFVVRGRRIRATRARIEQALEGVEPESIRAQWVTMGGRRYPVRQAFAVGTRGDSGGCQSTRSVRSGT